MSQQPSNYPFSESGWNYGIDQNDAHYIRCPRCKGSGIDPDCAKSHQDDEWDCIECEGYGDIEVTN